MDQMHKKLRAALGLTQDPVPATESKVPANQVPGSFLTDFQRQFVVRLAGEFLQQLRESFIAANPPRPSNPPGSRFDGQSATESSPWVQEQPPRHKQSPNHEHLQPPEQARARSPNDLSCASDVLQGLSEKQRTEIKALHVSESYGRRPRCTIQEEGARLSVDICAGYIPESIWELTNSEQLIIWVDDLKPLSPDIAKLTKLKGLFIEAMSSSEGFPEVICQLEQLEKLFATGCKLSVLPSSFASLRNLLELRLADNVFKQFPEMICELKNLNQLELRNNKLSSLPRSFAKLRELKLLNISKNCFKEFPRVVCELPNLENLDAHDNQLSELPLAITKLVCLKSLNLSRNSFIRIPFFVGDLPRLCEFNCSGWFNLLVFISHLFCSHLVQAILFSVTSCASLVTE